MKKTVYMLLALLLAVLVPVSALAEASGEKTLEELLAERARLDEEINRLQRDETILPGAIDALKEYWKQMYQSGKHGDGYLEIRSTRVFTSPIRFCRRTTRRHTSFLTTWFASWSLYCCRTTVIPRPIT